MFQLRRALLAAALVGASAFAFGAFSAAQAISCTGNANAPDSCTDADPFPTSYLSQNTPKDSLNGSPALAWLDYDKDTNTFTGAAGYAYNGYFNLTPTTDKAGTWTFDAAAAFADGLLLVPTMLAIKGGPNWGFYAFAGGTYGGSWNTSDLPLVGNGNVPDLSHLVFYDGARPPGAPP
jgi:hypothetical protein